MRTRVRRIGTAALVVPIGLSVASIAAPASAAPAKKPYPVTKLAKKAKARVAKGEPLPPVNFRDCPQILPAGVNPAEAYCTLLITTGGTMKIGKIEQKITKPMTITTTNWTDPVTGEPVESFVKMRAPQMRVAGGALGIPGSDDLVKLLRLSVQTKYAGGYAFDGINMGTAINLRIKVINPLMGDNCFIGTAKDPVKLNLKADPAQIVFIPSTPPALKLVASDTTFAVPGASGCGLLDPIANLRAGLPSAAGKNSATMVTYMVGKTYAELFRAKRKR